jgi:plastocyanin
MTLLGTAALATSVAALSLTGGAAGQPAHHAKTVTVEATGKGQNLSFNSVVAHTGDKLQIVNKTKDPHTLSLYVGHKLPKGNYGYSHCFTPRHPCLNIAKWHKFDGQNIHKQTVQAGHTGWDKMGSSAKNKGDSVFFPPKKGPKTRPITAKAGTTLHFICAIHPWMQGKIKVK